LTGIGANFRLQPVHNETVGAFVLALLAADEVLVPASSYFESAHCRRIVDAFKDAWSEGHLFLVGGARSLEEFIGARLEQYPPKSSQGKLYTGVLRTIVDDRPPYIQTTARSTARMKDLWSAAVDEDGFPLNMFGTDVTHLPVGFESLWAQMPERLGALPVLTEYVQPLIFMDQPYPALIDRLRARLNSYYFASLADDLGAGLVKDLVYLGARVEIRASELDLSYKSLQRQLGSHLRPVVAEPSFTRVRHLSEDAAVQGILAQSIQAQATDVAARRPAFVDHRDPGDMLRKVLQIPPGRDHAHKYHHAVAALLSNILQLSLVDQDIEREIFDGLKRIDILYRNAAVDGFFFTLPTLGHVPSLKVPVECKNYSKEAGNEEVDQLVGRFTPDRRLGMLVYREVVDRPRLLRRCHAVFAEQRHGVVLPLGDEQLRQLVDSGHDPGARGRQWTFFQELFDEVTG